MHLEQTFEQATLEQATLEQLREMLSTIASSFYVHLRNGDVLCSPSCIITVSASLDVHAQGLRWSFLDAEVWEAVAPDMLASMQDMHASFESVSADSRMTSWRPYLEDALC